MVEPEDDFDVAAFRETVLSLVRGLDLRQREVIQAIARDLDILTPNFRSNFLSALAASGRGEAWIMLPWRRDTPRHYLWPMSGEHDHLLYTCFENIRFGGAPLKLTPEGERILRLIDTFYFDEITYHIGPFSPLAHLRPPAKPKKPKKAKA